MSVSELLGVMSKMGQFLKSCVTDLSIRESIRSSLERHNLIELIADRHRDHSDSFVLFPMTRGS